MWNPCLYCKPNNHFLFRKPEVPVNVSPFCITMFGSHADIQRFFLARNFSDPDRNSIFDENR